MMKKDQQQTNLVKADLHEVTMPLIHAMHVELKELSKKKPDAVLSKNKVKIVNRLLESCRKVSDSETSLDYLDLIDEDDIPQNSDVVLMLSQYVAAMKQFKSTYYGSDGLKLRWFTE
ncbi:hypothetical protein [Nostoc sp. ChiSLP03a]|uniref:hypothetical protein n=1 Tax=Nostoc sp. ChiSLP03a TaxID=3075380 RepID=UPI002AD1EFDF|nr:hypothetical protein [Nostoc sp. ChiSLP03a]MDZ8215736.1 hypothetical protein [Nostoc sp. ChiSLP03a]